MTVNVNKKYAQIFNEQNRWDLTNLINALVFELFKSVYN